MPHRASSPAASENDFDITKSLFQDDAGSDDEDFALPSIKDLGALDAGGILDLESDGEGDEAFIASKQAASNRKASNVKGRSVKKGGGFQAMGMKPLFDNRGQLLTSCRIKLPFTQSYQQKRILCAYANSAKNDPPRPRPPRCCGNGKNWFGKDCCFRYTYD